MRVAIPTPDRKTFFLASDALGEIFDVTLPQSPSSQWRHINFGADPEQSSRYGGELAICCKLGESDYIEFCSLSYYKRIGYTIFNTIEDLKKAVCITINDVRPITKNIAYATHNNNKIIIYSKTTIEKVDTLEVMGFFKKNKLYVLRGIL